jgi:hypothetical protein
MARIRVKAAIREITWVLIFKSPSTLLGKLRGS